MLISALGAAATIPRIKMGWSSLDDGFYAYVADRLLHGEVIHRDFFSQYLGYQHFLHVLLFRIFGENYLVLRYPLPLFTFLTSLSASAIFKKYGWAYQIGAIAISSGFSYLLFNNPSTSWTCVYLAVLLAHLLTNYGPSNAPLKNSRLFFVGIIVGICFGIRHPTAVFLGMACFCITLEKFKYTRRSPPSPGRMALLATSFTAMAGLLFYAYKSGSISDVALWFSAPCIYVALAIANSTRTDDQKTLKGLLIQASGFIVALTPAIIYTLTTKSIHPLERDLSTFGANYSSSIGIHTWFLPEKIIDVVTNATSLATISASIVSITPFIYPAAVSIIITRTRSLPAESPLHIWTRAPLTIIASFHTLVILGLLRDMYLGYVFAPIMLSLLELIAVYQPKGALKALSLAPFFYASATSFFVMSAKLGGGLTLNYLGAGHVDWEQCTLPKCNLMLNKGLNFYQTTITKEIDKKIPKNSVINFIPWGYDFDFSQERENPEKIPDTRMPMLQGVSPDETFRIMTESPDTYFVVNKIYTGTSNIDPRLAELIMKSSTKIYEDEVFVIFKDVGKSGGKK